MTIFERATRQKLRFASSVGDLNVEQLWDLPLTAKADKPDLDKLARAVHAELKSIEDGSFVDVKPDPRKGELELKLDILKRIIEAKKADKAAAEKRAENAEQKRRLLAALDSKKEAELAGMTREQLEEAIAKLGDA
jgi:hypothetical protein